MTKPIRRLTRRPKTEEPAEPPRRRPVRRQPKQTKEPIRRKPVKEPVHTWELPVIKNVPFWLKVAKSNLIEVYDQGKALYEAESENRNPPRVHEAKTIIEFIDGQNYYWSDGHMVARVTKEMLALLQTATIKTKVTFNCYPEEVGKNHVRFSRNTVKETLAAGPDERDNPQYEQIIGYDKGVPITSIHEYLFTDAAMERWDLTEGFTTPFVVPNIKNPAEHYAVVSLLELDDACTVDTDSLILYQQCFLMAVMKDYWALKILVTKDTPQERPLFMYLPEELEAPVAAVMPLRPDAQLSTDFKKKAGREHVRKEPKEPKEDHLSATMGHYGT